MLYKKNNTPKLDEKLFKEPTAEYRGAPFWAWNCELDKEELLRQIHCLKEIGFGSVKNMGMPFYSGNIVYETKIYTGKCDIEVYCGQYRGAFVEVSVDGKESVPVAFAPYKAVFEGLEEGEHTLKFTLYSNRQNTFGPLHNWNEECKWIGPNAWYTKGSEWSYNYRLADIGIITLPVINIYNEKK